MEARTIVDRLRGKYALDAVAYIRQLEAALRWYGEQAEGCRKLGSVGDPFRHALDADGGKRAREVLTKSTD